MSLRVALSKVSKYHLIHDSSKRLVSTSTFNGGRRKLLLVGGSAFLITLAAPQLANGLPKSITDQWSRSQTTVSAIKQPDSRFVRLIPVQSLDNIKVSRSIRGQNSVPGHRLILFQYQGCPYCSKVRAYLDYKNIAYDIVEVNPLTRKELRFSPYRKVPVVILQGDSNQEQALQLNDSSVIISILDSFLLQQSVVNETKSDLNRELLRIAQLYQSAEYQTESNSYDLANKYFVLFEDNYQAKQSGETENALLEERKWRKWADDVLVHTLSPNVYSTMNEALETFHHFSSVSDWKNLFGPVERQMAIYVGASVMYVISKHLKRKHNLKQDVRLSLYDACNYFMRSKGSKRPFVGGSSPNLADLAVFGVLRSIEGCRAFDDLQQNSNIITWYNAMKMAIGEPQVNA